MSESSSPTRCPSWARRMARLVATVDLPTPPLPLATATTCLTPGRVILLPGAPGGCMLFSAWGLTLRALAQLAQVFEREDAGVVPVAPGDLIGVMADRREGRRPQRRQLGRFEDAEGIHGLDALLAAAGAGAVVAQ